MLENVSAEIIGVLRDAGIDAREKFYGGDIREVKQPCVFVGFSGVKAMAAGLGHYMGVRVREDKSQTELFGLRCEIEIAMDICVAAQSLRCAEACAAIFDKVIAALDGLGGLSILGVGMGSGAVEAKSGLYKLPCTVSGNAYIITESDDGAEFADFILKGVLKNEC